MALTNHHRYIFKERSDRTIIEKERGTGRNGGIMSQSVNEPQQGRTSRRNRMAGATFLMNVSGVGPSAEVSEDGLAGVSDRCDLLNIASCFDERGGT